jgi:4'-phosphopantetheinyl transferase EntD
VQLSEVHFAELVPDGSVVETAPPALLLDELFEEERAQIARAVDKRKAEYATARVLARRAFERIGAPAVALVNDEERCPIWPHGVVGSIAHTKGVCAVVVAPRGRVESIGLDVEVDTPARPELFERICTPSELAWIASRREDEAGRLVKLFFSAKEAFYKCQYPLTRQYLGFHDVEVALDVEGGAFEVELRRDAGAFGVGARFIGEHRRTSGFLLAAACRSARGQGQGQLRR